MSLIVSVRPVMSLMAPVRSVMCFIIPVGTATCPSGCLSVTAGIVSKWRHAAQFAGR